MPRRPPLAGLLLVAVLVAGCGVRPSGVITGGPAPTDREPAPVEPPRDVALYFLAGSTPSRVTRPAGQRLRPVQTLALLQQGPDGDERAAHLTSAVPAGLGPVSVTTDASGTVDVVVSADVAALPATAVDQIVCTVSDALPGGAPVRLVSGATTRGPRGCPVPPAAPGSGP